MWIYSIRSNRALSAGLYILILSAFAIYTWIVVTDAKRTRIESAINRNQETARLSARFVDLQWRELTGVMRLIVIEGRRSGLALGSDPEGSWSKLQLARRTVPDLLSATIYRSDGTLFASDSDPSMATTSTRHWLDEIGSIHEIGGNPAMYVGWEQAEYSRSSPARTDAHGDGMMVVAMRLSSSTTDSGFLVGRLRAHAITDWMGQFAGSESAVYLLDAERRLVAASSGARSDMLSIAGVPIEAAMNGKSGGMMVNERSGRRLVVGYAPAAGAHWAVLATQSEESVLAPAYILAAQFAVLIVPMLLVISAIIGLLNGMFARQEKMREQLELQNANLQHAQQVRSDFLANVSHDLRTPLTSMSIALSGLLYTEAAWDRDEARTSIQFVSEEIDLLEARVRNLLEMSRLEAQAQDPRIAPDDLTDIVGAAMERLQPLLSKRNLVLRFPDEPLMVSCDSTQIETVLVNLLENAVKYSPSGSTLTLTGERRENDVRFSVEDRGSGIEIGHEEQIFEKFYRSAQHADTQGTGLGLAICKAIVEANGGSIGAENVREGGARFWFTLPPA